MLFEKKYVTHYELAELYSESPTLCIKTFGRFIQDFETNLDLVLWSQQYE